MNRRLSRSSVDNADYAQPRKQPSSKEQGARHERPTESRLSSKKLGERGTIKLLQHPPTAAGRAPRVPKVERIRGNAISTNEASRSKPRALKNPEPDALASFLGLRLSNECSSNANDHAANKDGLAVSRCGRIGFAGVVRSACRKELGRSCGGCQS